MKGQSRPSLSRRVLWFTVAVMLVTEVLVFLPGLADVRHRWLEAHVATGELAVLAAHTGQNSQIERREVLRLAGVMSARLQEPGHPFLQLAENGQIIASDVADLRSETIFDAIGATIDALLFRPVAPLLVVSPSTQRVGALLSVVLDAGPMTGELRASAVRIALQGLAIAVVTGGLIYWTLVLLLVRPMRRLTDSIQAFRADPERTPPLESPTGEGGDEIATAAAELAAMQRELRTALWRNARLAAIGTAMTKVSHDLRGILSTALLAAERLQLHPDDKIRNSGDAIARAVERATDLVKRTLDFARQDPSAPLRESVRLNDAADEAVEQARAVRPTIAFNNRIPPAMTVQADRLHLLRIFGNLMRNAAEAGASSLQLTAESAAEVIVITLSDNGPGLPVQVQAHLFKPFVAGGRRGGTGLGMAIAQDLIRAHGGEIALVSTGASGTVFRIALPHPTEMHQA